MTQYNLQYIPTLRSLRTCQLDRHYLAPFALFLVPKSILDLPVAGGTNGPGLKSLRATETAVSGTAKLRIS